ncbi:PKD domain-containing protein [Flavobacterium hauense]
MKKHYNKDNYKNIVKTLLLISFLVGNVFILSAQNCVVNAGVLNVSICENDALLLDGNSPSPILGTVHWTQISGPSVIITSPTSPTSTVTGYTGGNTYVFRYSAMCGDGVVAFQDKTVVVYPITIANAGPDIASCPNSSGSIVASGNEPQNPGEVGHWEISGGNPAGVVINFPNSAVTTLTLPATSCGTTTLNWIIEGPDYAPGQNCTSSSSMTVTNYGGATPIYAGSDINLGNCYTTTQNTNLNGSYGGCGLNGQNGTWAFVSGPNNPTIANVNQNNTNVSDLIQGTYVFRWTVTGPCVSGSDTVSIIVPAATQDITTLPGGDVNIYFCDPTISQVTLVAQTPLYAGETVQWTQVGGTTLPPGSIQSPNSPSTLVTGINDAGDPYRFRYALTNNNTGCTFSKDYIVEYRGSSRTITVNNGDDLFGACNETDFSIPIVTTGTGISRYRILSGPATSPLAPFPTAGQNVGTVLNISLTEPGTYVLQFLISETGELPLDCDYGYDSMTIVVSGSPTPSNAGSDVNLACGLTTAPLAGVGTAPTGSHYWTQLSGPNTAVIVDPLSQNTTAQGLVSGSYVFQYITKGGGSACAYSIDTVNINVSSSTLSAVNAGTDQSVCADSQVVLVASVPDPGEFGTWSQVSGPPTVVFSDVNDPNATATGFDSPNDTYVLRWTIAYSFPSSSGCSAPVSDDVSISTNAITGASLANAGPDACYPGGTTSITLSGNTPGVLEQGTWSAMPSSGVVFIDINDPNTGVTIPANGSYIFTWSINKIIGSCNPTTDTAEVTVADTVITVIAGPDQDVCGNQVIMAATLPSGGAGTWTQVSGLGGYSISDIHDPNATFTFTLSGGYLFRWTVVAGTCSTGFDDVRLRVGISPATAIAGPDQNICGATTAAMAGSPYDAFFETGEWSLLSGAPNQPVITNALDPNTTITNLITGTYTFRWTIASKENFLCPATFDDVVIEVSPAADAGSDQTHCDVDNVRLTGNFNSKGTWALTSGNPTGVVITQSPANSFVANATVVPGNTYEFTYTLDAFNFTSGGTCAGNADSVNVEVFDGSSADPNAGPDQNLCISDVAGTVTMAGNTPPVDVDSGLWRFVFQPTGSIANITAPTSPVTTVTNMTIPGLYVLEWVFLNTSCRDLSDIVRITMYQAPSTANAGSDDTVACQQTYQTNAIAPIAGLGTWTFAPGGDPSVGAAVIDNPNNPQTTLSNVTTLGTYTLLWTVTNGPFTNPSLCQPSTDTVSITFNALPPTQAAAGPDQQLCAATQTNLAAVPLTEGLGTWTQTSGPNTANIASPNAPNTTVFGLVTGTYEFTWTATTQNNDGCSSFDTMQVVIVQQPVTADAGPNQVIAQFTPVVMAATAPTVGVGTWTQLSGPTTASFVNVNSPTTQVSGTAAGTYVFQWQISNGICSTASDVVSVQILSLADLELTNLVTPTTANYGDVIALTVSVFNNPALGGSVDATGVAIKNMIPAGFTLVPGSVSNGGVYNIGDQSITWSGLTVLNGATLNLTFNATVNQTGSYLNIAQVIAMDQVDDDSTPNNDDGDQSEDDEDNAVITAVPPPADLYLTKTVVANNVTPLVGSQITFEVVISNSGTEDATGVSVQDLLPTGYDYVSFSSSKGVYDEITGIWTIGGIASGDLESLLVDVIVLPTGDYTNVAQVQTSDQPDNDSTPGNNVTTEDDYASVSTTPVALSADLSILKTIVGGNTSPLIGSQVSFEIVVTNSGPQNATGVLVTDLLPTGYTYVIFSATAGTYNSATGVWNIGTLADGDSETLIITATVNATGIYQNIAEVIASNLADPDSSPGNGVITEDDYSSINITPTALAADLSLTKTVNNTTPLVGSQVIFTVTVSNSGPNNTTGVTVTDQLPTGYTFVSSTATQGGYVSGTGVWTVGAMVNGASEILQITAIVNASGIYLNTAQVTASSLPDTDSTVNNGVTTEDDYAEAVTAPVPVDITADLQIDKIVDNPTPVVGTNVTFTIAIANAGPSDASGIIVADLLPSGYTYVSYSTTAGIYDAPSGSWIVGAMQAGNFHALQITATVNATGDYTNIAEIVTSSQPDPDSTPGNGVTTEDDYAEAATLPIPLNLSADLAIGKIVDNPTPVVGTNVTFTIAINNAGPADTTNVIVADFLPTGYTFVSYSATTGLYDPFSGLWFINTMQSGDSEALQITATVNATGDYNNIAEITDSSQPDPDSTVNNGVTTEDDYASAITTPTPLVADLSLTKTVNNATPLVGSQVTFTITVTNAGPNNTTGVTVTDLLPTGYTYVSSTTTQGGYVAGTGVWNVGSIANGASEILQVTATVNASGVYLNSAQVTASSLPDPDSIVNNGVTTEDDYAATATIPIGTSADLSLTKTVNDSTLTIGDQAIFEIIVTNYGPQNTTGVVVTDLLASIYTFESYTVSTGTYNNTTGLWTVGNLSNGQSETLQIIVTANAVGTYTNTAEITASNQSDPDSTPNNGVTTEDDYAAALTAVSAQVPIDTNADLSITKTVNNTNPLVGTQVTFTITISNEGPFNATGVAITDLLPSGYTYVSYSATEGTYNPSSGVWTITQLPDLRSETLQITATVNATGNYTNIAEVTASSQTDPDSTPNNAIITEDDYATAITTPTALASDLSLTKTVNNPTPLVGSQVIFTVTVTNAGPNNTTGVIVTDLLPTGYTYVSSTTTQGGYITGTGVWTVGAMANGASEILQVTATVNPTGPYINTAEVTTSSQPDPDSTVNNGVTTEDDYASVTTVPVGTAADLSLTKTVNNPIPVVGTLVTFSVTVSNAGPQSTSGVTVTDLLPAGYTFVSYSSTLGSYNAVTGLWTVGTIASGASYTLQVTATVNPTGSYINTAEVTASSLPDTDSTVNNGAILEDDYATAITVPTALSADLSLTKTIVGGNTTPLVGSQISFEIVMSNSGPNNVTGVQVTDLLPTGYTYNIFSATSGTYNSGTGVWNVGSLANGDAETLIVTATVNASGNYQNVAEVIASSLSDPDSTVNNGVITEDDYASVTAVPVQISADLSITKTVGNPTPLVGSGIVFTVVVTNNGPQDATGIQVTDQLPSGYSYIVATTTTGVYSNSTGIWLVGTIASGASETLLINASVLSSGNYLNIAEITTSSLPDPDSTPGNANPTEDDYASAITTPVAIAADLSLTKIVNNPTPLVGTGVTFELIITNNGPQGATGVEITDQLPSGYAFVIASSTAGIYNSATGVWIIGALASGASETLLINGTVLPTGNYQNVAEVTASNQPDPDSTVNNGITTEDDYASAITVPVAAAADLSLSKTIVGGITNPLVGTQIIFNVTVSNAGPQTATGVLITDILPAGYTFVSYTATKGAYNTGTGVWDVSGTIPSGTSETLQITVVVNAAGPYLNTAEITSSNIADPDSTPNNAVITEDDYASAITFPTTISADLSLTKTVNNAAPLIGSSVTFEIIVTNSGPQGATNVQVTDQLPSGYSYVLASATEGIYNSATGIWAVGTLASGASESLLINGTVLPTGNYLNIAEVTTSNVADPDSTPGNGVTTEDDYASAVTVPVASAADLSLTKTIVGGNTTPLVGTQLIFNVTVSNAGPQPTTGVLITDQLPAGYTFVSYTATVGAYNEATGVWDLSSAIASGTSETLQITVVVNGTGAYLNIAEITASNIADPDSTPANAVTTEDDYASIGTVPIAVSADLSLTKTVNNATPAVGAPVTFEVVITNNGPQTATGVQVTDQLPSGYTYVLASTTAGIYNSATGVWVVGNLANGFSETMLINGTVLPTGNYLNIAEVSASNLPDPDSTPNNGITTEDDYASAITIPVVPMADLSLAKTIVGGNSSPLVGNQVIFEVTVSNAGPQSVNNIQISDLLPSGYTFVSYNATEGVYNGVTGLWSIGSVIASGASHSLQVTAIVNAAGNYLNVAEITASSLPDPDSTVNNGITTEDDYASVITTPIPVSADLSLTKTVNNATPLVGASVTFEVIITNNGPQVTTGVQVTDLLPSGYTYILASSTAGTYNATNGLWNIGSLANGASETLLINATVNVTGNYVNIAQVSASSLPDLDSTPANNIATEDDQASATVVPITQVADLSLTKTVIGGDLTPLVDSQVSFEIVVTNAGPQTASGVQVTDLLPTGYTYVIHNATAGNYNSTTGVWNIGTLFNSDSETLIVTAAVNAAGSHTNTAQITASSLPDPDSTPNNAVTSEDDFATVTQLPIPLMADLSLQKTVVGGNLNPIFGSTITFQVTVTNNGPQDAAGVKVLDLLPSGYEYLVFSSTAGTYNQNSGIWNIGTILNDATETLLMTVKVLPGGNYLNIAEIFESNRIDPNSTPNNNIAGEDDEDNVLLSPMLDIADLSVTKEVLNNQLTPLAGTHISFVVTVSNSGPGAAGGVVLRDLLPSGYDFEFYNATSGAYDEATGEWNVGIVLPGGTETLIVNVIVNSPTGTVDEYLNEVEVIALNQSDPDSTPDNGATTEDDYASIAVVPIVPSADLSITKTVNNPTPLVGSSVTFEIIVTNNGPQDTAGVQLTDLLPAGYAYVLATTTSGVYNNSTGVWTISSLADGISETLLVNAIVLPTGDYLNVAEVTASSLTDPDSTPDNGITTEDDYASVATIPVPAVADVSLTKTVNNPTPVVGAQVTFEIIVTNNGPQTALGVQVTDILPTGYLYVLASSTVGVYNNGTGIWQVGTIVNEASETLLINAIVLGNGDYVNIAEVTSSAIFDPDSTPGNNIPTEDDQASATVVPIIQSADLSLIKTVNNTVPVEGEQVTFEITVANDGPQVATGVQAIDLLPSGYAYVISSTTSGTYNPSTGLWNIGTIGNGNAQTLLVTATVLPTGNYLNIAQVTASDLHDPDSTPNNDDQSEDDEDSVTIQVQSTDIAITKDVDVSKPVMDDNVVFTITASNLGTTAATNVEVMDILPTGYEFISLVVTSGSYDSGSGLWEISSISSGSQESMTVTVKVVDKNDYLNTATLTNLDQIDTNSANDSDSAEVQPKCLKIYNEFSPNDDGDNDTFHIDCISLYPNNVLEIFNRWGDKVYSRKAYDNTWDGTSDGPEKTLPVGTYFYILDLGDGSDKTSGWLYIKR